MSNFRGGFCGYKTSVLHFQIFPWAHSVACCWGVSWPLGNPFKSVSVGSLDALASWHLIGSVGSQSSSQATEPHNRPIEQGDIGTILVLLWSTAKTAIHLCHSLRHASQPRKHHVDTSTTLKPHVFFLASGSRFAFVCSVAH